MYIKIKGVNYDNEQLFDNALAIAGYAGEASRFGNYYSLNIGEPYIKKKEEYYCLVEMIGELVLCGFSVELIEGK